MTSQKMYLGRLYDLQQGTVTDRPLLYDPNDLTTHAVVVGMTGSGKTGLCVALLEEAALQGIPAIVIDPKGDLTNLLLHFPNLAPQDFLPWLDAEAVRRQGKTLEQVAAETAQTWREGLLAWGISSNRLQALKQAVQFAVFTPGSDAGIPVSVLASLSAPGLQGSNRREELTERINSTVTALLGLVGLNEVDPLTSREHILLANIFYTAWSQNRSLDLTELIVQIQNPPFEKLGAFPVDVIFPPKERLALAFQLNNILAAPSFELWRIGQPLEVADLLYTADGRPRLSVFYLAHLADAERMFFVTLLLSAVETWMRAQPGSPGLRALLYMDEIFGYLPPQRNPSSKGPLLRMLKQARAFGLGLLLATQNPVDVDYKALSNAGTWFIGKLQTDQDKQRLLDGLESAAGGTLNRLQYDRLISSLGKRIFLMHNVHAQAPVLFQTRWVMNYLAGPLTRAQIPALNRLAGATVPSSSPDGDASSGRLATETRPQALAELAAASAAALPLNAPTFRSVSVPSLARPAVPPGVGEYFLPLNLSLARAAALANLTLPAGGAAQIVYRPALLASARLRFFQPKYHLDTTVVKSVLVQEFERRGFIRWEKHLTSLPDPDAVDLAPDPQARFLPLELPLSDGRQMATLRREFLTWVYQEGKITLRANQTLGLYATPEVSQAEFMRACTEAARQARDREAAKVAATFDRQIKNLKEKIAREERELKMDEAELAERRREELATHAENVLGLFSGRRSVRRLSSSLTKRRLAEQARKEVEESLEALAQYRAELEALEAARQKALNEVSLRWGEVVNDITEIPLAPRKSDISLQAFGVGWIPYYRVELEGQVLELPAFRL